MNQRETPFSATAQAQTTRAQTAPASTTREATLSRRTLLVGVAAAAAAMPTARNTAWAQTLDGWFALVKAQHVQILAKISEIIDYYPTPSPARTGLLQYLSYLLTAHSVAEENVLYPALVFHGLTVDSADLYAEQQFQKVWNREIDLLATQGAQGTEWLNKVTNLQAALIEHATVHEEGDYYPKLQALLTPDESAALTTAYQQQYSSVQPVA